MRKLYATFIAAVLLSGLLACGQPAPSGLYPPIEPLQSGLLKVSETHEIYWETVGNPDGIPVIVLHGGPGGSAGPEDAEAVAAPLHPGPPVWLHGDLHPGNVIVRNDRIVSVVDWGDITSGDPACDLAVFWRMFDAPTRAIALRSLNVDQACMLRARGWAVAIALMLLTNSDDRPLYLALGHRSIDAILT